MANSQESWREYASCRGLPLDMFFPKEGGPNKTTQLVVKMCQRCYVRSECLTEELKAAVSDGTYVTQVGIFGGTFARQRAELLKEMGVKRKKNKRK